jgi:phosphoglycerol transferase MdoB-like AlkP superfamily enzyme
LKTKLFPVLQDFIRICICFLPVIPVIRVLEYLTLRGTHNLPEGSGYYLFTGLLPDLSVFFLISLLSLVPYVLLGLLSRRSARIAWLTGLSIYSLFYFALISYFSITLVPLDQVIFSYTLQEMVTISASSTRFTLLTFLPFLLLPAILLTCYYLLRKLMPGRYLVAGIIIVFAFSPVFLSNSTPQPRSYEQDFQYYLAINKPLYLVRKCRQYLREGARPGEIRRSPDAAMLEQFSLYHRYHPEFTFIGPTYPLVHTEETPDVLGGFFNLGGQKPNLVFIIVESLSSAFCGDRPYLGSFTPFLDSLSRHSLYWENCMASSERTFYVLPAMFGSLPYGSGMYLDNLTRSSYHLSLIRYLNNNGYVSRFFYGGDPAFNQMDNFLHRNNTGYLLSTWGPGYTTQSKAESGFKWGYPDHELFRRSFEVMDSLKETPYLDIYLTLSMHAPFIPPDAEKWRTRYLNRLNEIGFNENERALADKCSDIFATVLYTDDALRSFFNEYRKRPDFGNTIFFITGDHSLPELNIGWYSPMERFRVPFMIYSPLLKTPKTFRSVITHLDVTPSVLAMLRDSYHLETHPMAPWLGVGFDTAAAFRSARSVVFIRNNKEMVDYIDSGYCLSDGRLYLIKPDMQATLVRDPLVSDRLQKKLDNYIRVTQYVGSANTLIPIWMLFGKTVTEEAVPVADSLKYSGEYTSDGYITVLKKMQFRGEFKYVSLQLSFRFFSQEQDPEKIPRIVFDVTDSAGSKLLWNQYPLFGPGEYKPGQWNRVTFNQTMDLSFIRDVKSSRVGMYLWNTHSVTVRCDSLVKKIWGYK